MGLGSLATVHKHVTALQQKGYLKRPVQRKPFARGLRGLPAQRAGAAGEADDGATAGIRGLTIPLMGTIAAGVPVEAPESPETLDFADFAGSPNLLRCECAAIR